MEDNFERMLALDDVSLPHSLRRSVWLIGDEEDGNNYTADEILDDKPQDIIFNMRATLTAAYKSGESKYVCPFCGQPVGLRVRTNKGDFFPFFSHYQDSNDNCPIKTINDVDPTRIIISSENLFRESVLHQDMVSKLKEILELSADFKEIEANKVISNPEVKGYRRPSLYSRYHDDNIICFDALLSNPQIGLLVGRNAFYKMQKMFYLWVFPDFSVQYQRMCEKDILYMNRRNVFVFDSRDYYNNTNNRKYLGSLDPNRKFAYEESIRQKRLMLNCYWQVPVLDEKKNVSITWKGPELVPFDEIVLDNNNYESYYHDSDQDFYHSYSLEKQRIIDDWMRIKEDRWRKIFDSIEKRKLLYEQALARRERRERLAYYYPLIESGEITPEPYKDERNGLWGYRIGDLDVIVPTYYDAHPFYSGFAWVRKKEKWGVINFKGEKICNFEYNDIRDLKDGLFSVYDNRFRNLVDYKGEEIKRGFDSITQFSNGRAKAQKNNKWGLIDEKGNEVYEIIQFSNGLKMYHSLYRERYGLFSDSPNNECEFIYDAVVDLNNGQIKALMDNNWGILDNKGKEVCEAYPVGGGYYKYYSNFYKAYGLMTNDKKPLTEPRFRVVRDMYHNLFVCQNKQMNSWRNESDNKWGGINIEGKTIIPFIYDKFKDFVDNKAIVKKGKIWGEIDINGNEIPELSILNNGFYVYKSRFNGTCGLMDSSQKILTDQLFIEIKNFIDGKAEVAIKRDKNDEAEWGTINEKGEEIFKNSDLGHVLLKYKSVIQNKIGIKKLSGDIVTDLIYDEIGNVYNGEIEVKKGEYWGVIDIKGNEVIPICFISLQIIKVGLFKIKITPDVSASLYGCSINGNKCGVINKDNNIIIPFEYDDILDFSEGRAWARKYGKWGVIDVNGETVLDFQFNKLDNFIYNISVICQKEDRWENYREWNRYQRRYYNRSHVVTHERWGLVNKKGDILIPLSDSRIFIEGVVQNMILVRKGGFCGAFDNNNNIVIPLSYDGIEILPNGKVKAKKNYKYGLIDLEGNTLIPFEYDELKEFSENIYAVRKIYKWGILDAQGQIILPVKYKEIGELNEGKAVIEDNEKIEIINCKGKILTPEEQSQDNYVYTTLSNGMVKYNYHDRNMYGLMSPEKTVVTEMVFDEIQDFNNGHACAMKNKKWGYINEKGEEIYERIILSNGLIKEISKFNDNCRLVDSNEQVIIDFFYHNIDDFSGGYARVHNGYYWGVVNDRGEETVPCDYHELGKIKEGKITAKIKGSWGIIDTHNKIIVPFKYDELGEYQKGKIKARLSSKWGFVDGEGGRGISFNYDKVSDFSEGKAICVIDDMYGVIDQRGRTLIPFEYYDIKGFINGSAIAQNDDFKWGAIDENGCVTIPFEFDEICSFKNGKARASKGDLWGFINVRGETLIPFEYNQLEDFVDGKAQALKFSSDNNFAYENWGYINEKGEEIIEYKALSNGMTAEIYPLQGKQRFVNRNGVCISNQNYTDFEDFVDGKLICAKGYNKWGVVDENFQEYIPFAFYKINYLGQNRFEVTEEIKQRWGGRKYIKKTLPKEIEKDDTDTHGQINMQNTIYDGVVDGKAPFGLFVRVPNVGKGLIRRNNIIKSGKGINDFKKGDKIKVIVLKINNDNGRVYYGLS